MVCLVTGSSRGLGRAIALTFGRRGHAVAVHCRSKKEEAQDVSSRIKDSLVLKADVRDSVEVRALVDKVLRRWGKIDVLVNNAGITKENLLIRTSERNFNDVMDINLKGPFNLIRTVSPHMMKQKRGHIINVSSIAGVKGKAGLGAYSASKAALIGLTKTSAKELAGDNILVNAILPGFMLTDMVNGSSGTGKETALKESLIKEFSEPGNVAEFICNLAEAKGITGQVFNLDSRIV